MSAYQQPQPKAIIDQPQIIQQQPQQQYTLTNQYQLHSVDIPVASNQLQYDIGNQQTLNGMANSQQFGFPDQPYQVNNQQHVGFANPQQFASNIQEQPYQQNAFSNNFGRAAPFQGNQFSNGFIGNVPSQPGIHSPFSNQGNIVSSINSAFHGQPFVQQPQSYPFHSGEIPGVPNQFSTSFFDEGDPFLPQGLIFKDAFIPNAIPSRSFPIPTPSNVGSKSAKKSSKKAPKAKALKKSKKNTIETTDLPANATVKISNNTPTEVLTKQHIQDVFNSK